MMQNVMRSILCFNKGAEIANRFNNDCTHAGCKTQCRTQLLDTFCTWTDMLDTFPTCVADTLNQCYTQAAHAHLHVGPKAIRGIHKQDTNHTNSTHTFDICCTHLGHMLQIPNCICPTQEWCMHKDMMQNDSHTPKFGTVLSGHIYNNTVSKAARRRKST